MNKYQASFDCPITIKKFGTIQMDESGNISITGFWFVGPPGGITGAEALSSIIAFLKNASTIDVENSPGIHSCSSNN